MKKQKTALLSATLVLFPLLTMSPEVHAARHDRYRHDRDIIANWKDYYVGKPSFKIENEDNLKKFNERINKTNENIKQYEGDLKPFTDIISSNKKEIDKRNTRNAQIDKETLAKTKERIKVDSTVRSLSAAIKITVDEAKKAELQVKLDTAKAELTKVDLKLKSLVTEKDENEKKNIASKKRITQAKESSKKLNLLLAKLKDNLGKIKKKKRIYKKQLVLDILQRNDDGSFIAKDHAREDADELAFEEGELYGIRDGAREGEIDGINEGKDIVRRDAEVNGNRVGLEQALENGTRDGRAQGFSDGNRRIGKEHGYDAGLLNAKNSDAKSRGTSEGITSGKADAKRVGQFDGTMAGENNAISKNENSALKKVTSDGQFVGAFSKFKPTYPEQRSRGRRYVIRGDFKKMILKEAYKDGYRSTYNRVHRRHFNERVEVYYENFRKQQYELIFNIFASKDYPEVRRVAFETSRSNTYNGNYSRYRQDAFNESSSRAYDNPTTSSDEYRGSYEQSKDSSYRDNYARIKSDAKSIAYKETYEVRYPIEKEIAQTSAFNSTQNLYDTSSVLKLESIEVVDAGIEKVGQQDGIVQPNENKTYNLTVSNYGKVAKTGVKIMIDGVSFSVGNIPARTTTTFKAVAKSKVNGVLNSRDRDQITVVASAKNKIEARHFSSAKDGILANQNKDNGMIQYPLSLDHLSLGGELLRGKAVNLRARVANKSSKTYSGVKVVIESDTDGMVKKSFTDLNNFRGSKTISDAVVSITKKSETYSPISVSAYLEKNGVIVGDASKALNTYAKEVFDNSKKTVVIVDSHSSLREAKDLISKAGGLEKATILDTSIRNANNAVLASGLKEKAVVISSNGNVISKVRETLRKSQDTALVAIDSKTFQKLTDINEIYKHNTYADFSLANRSKKTGIRFANPRVNKSVKSSLPIISANRADFSTELNIARVISKTNDKLISELNSKIKENNFFNGNKEINVLVEGATIKAMDDIFQINKEYIEGKKSKVADQVKKDSSLFHNKLNTAIGNKARSSNIGLYMFASELVNSVKEGLKKHKQYKKIMRTKIVNRLFEYKKVIIFGKKRKGPLGEVESKLGSISKVSKSVSSKLNSSKGQHKPYNLEK